MTAHGPALCLAATLVACGGGTKTRVTVAIEGCIGAEARLLVFATPDACTEEDPATTAAGGNDPVASTPWLDPDGAGPIAIDVPSSGPVAVVVQCRDGELVRQWGCGVQQGDAVRVVAAPVCSERCAPTGSCPVGAEAWTGGGGDICVARCLVCDEPAPDAGVDAAVPTDAGEDAASPDGGGCLPEPSIVQTVAVAGKSLDLARLDADRLAVASGGAGGLQVLRGALAALVVADGHDLSEAFGLGVAADHVYVAEGSIAEAENNIEVLSIAGDGTIGNPSGLVVPGEVHDVEVQAEVLYAAAGSEGLRLLSVSTPGSPQPVSDVQPGGDVLDVALLGTRAIVAAGSAGVHVVDVTTSEDPRGVSTYAAASGARAVATDPGTSLVLVARGADGVELLELQGDNLVLRGHVETDGTATGVRLAAGRGWVADGEGGLAVVDLERAVLIGVVPTPAVDDAFVEDVLVEGAFALLAAGYDGLYLVDVACLL